MTGPTKALLLVEDNPSDEALTLRAFKKSKIANPIVVVRDGAEALDYLFCTGRHAARQPATLPAVMLLDLKLPKVDGIEVLKRLREDQRTKMLPVVVLTSSMEHKDLVDSYSLGVNSYIRNPVEFERFMQAVSQLGVYWLVLNELPPIDQGN
jgi:two-component system response regulator